jgi:hypothetical protein
VRSLAQKKSVDIIGNLKQKLKNNEGKKLKNNEGISQDILEYLISNSKK